MPVEMFLKLDGITGGTRNFNHKGWADLISWGWDLQSNRNASRLVEGEKTAFKQMSIVKRIGMDSPDIMSMFVQGGIIASAEIDVLPIVSRREARQKYLSIRMEEVRVRSIVTGGNAAEEFFIETIVLLFGRIHYEFSVNKVPDSDVAAADYRFAWDIANNKPWQRAVE